ncbi:Simvastatin synthase [Xylariaceae sp. FL0016]|nr:Simvastatin synthase [Xylariaceae sp. FL0016]
MDVVDQAFKDAVADGSIHGAVLLAKDTSGRVNVSRSYGVRSLRDADPEKRPPMEIDTPMRIASASKLLSSIMVLQCVDQGLVGLDDTLHKLLPEVAKQKVLTGFDDDGKPIEREPKTPVLVRHLLAHTSGISYALPHPLLTRFRKGQGVEVDQGYDTLDENFQYPLIFDPGTSNTYGPGLDWSSRLIARASGMPTEEFLQKNLVEPLGLTADDMTFELQKHPKTQERRSDMTWRADGIYTSPEAYMRVLWSILSNDGKLLKPGTRDFVFEPDLSHDVYKGVEGFLEEFKAWGAGAPVPAEIKKSVSVAGLVTLEDCDGDRWRRKGNLSWSGLPNFIWNIDPEAGLCSVWAFHLKPSFDPTCMALGKKFEEAVFAMVKS